MGTLDYLVGDEAACRLAASMTLNIVGEEKQLQHHEDNEKLDEYHSPKGLAQGHVPEAIIIEVNGAIEETVLVHSCPLIGVGYFKLMQMYVKNPNLQSFYLKNCILVVVFSSLKVLEFQNRGSALAGFCWRIPPYSTL